MLRWRPLGSLAGLLGIFLHSPSCRLQSISMSPPQRTRVCIQSKVTTTVYPTAKPEVLPRLLSPGQMLFAQYIKDNYTLRQLRLETRELGLKTFKNKKEMARRIVEIFDSACECP